MVIFLNKEKHDNIYCNVITMTYREKIYSLKVYFRSETNQNSFMDS